MFSFNLHFEEGFGVLTSFNTFELLSFQIVKVVSDNGSNMLKAVKLMDVAASADVGAPADAGASAAELTDPALSTDDESSDEDSEPEMAEIGALVAGAFGPLSFPCVSHTVQLIFEKINKTSVAAEEMKGA